MNKEIEILERAVHKLKWDMSKLENDFEQSECARKTAIESLHIYKNELEQRGFEIIALKAENARYREALEDIVHCIYSNEATLAYCEKKAREALKGGE